MIACGDVVGLRAGLAIARMPRVPIGAPVTIESGARTWFGTVCALENDATVVRVRGTLDGLVRGAIVREYLGDPRAARVGMRALGSALTTDGVAIDDGQADCVRAEVADPLWTGVRAIDTMLTIGRGARVGIFGAPGLGKSTLLETIVRGTHADAVVVALCGERGREAQEWLQRLNPRMTVVVATSDRPAAERVDAAWRATAHARALARRGLHVLIVLDSLARFAAAARECALALGEPVGRAGFPPSVVGDLARLCERCGSFRTGSITMIATVLDDGDERDPISDAARSLLDGHIQLSAAMAHAGHFPAIDLLSSASRTMHLVASPEHQIAAHRVRAALALLAQTADARSLGIHATHAGLEPAVAAQAAVERFLCQGREPERWADSLEFLRETADILEVPHGYFE